MGVIKTIITIIKSANLMLKVYEYIYMIVIAIVRWGLAVCCEDCGLINSGRTQVKAMKK